MGGAMQQLDMVLGAVEPKREERPLATPVRQQRDWWRFETKDAALVWSFRNAPIIKDTRIGGLSAHPRVVSCALGGFSLIYRGGYGKRPASFALLYDQTLRRV